jgi:hypothetical protein
MHTRGHSIGPAIRRFGAAVAVAVALSLLAATPAQAADPGGTALGGTALVSTARWAAPTVGSVTPNTGPPYAPTQITIRGSGFTRGARVLVGGRPATLVRVLSAREIVAWTPPVQLGVDESRWVSVQVLTRSGAATRPDAFGYRGGSDCQPVLRDQVIRRGETFSSWCLGFEMAPGTTLTVEPGGSFFAIGTIQRLVARAHGGQRPQISGWLWFGAADVKGAVFGGPATTLEGQYTFGGVGRSVVRDSVFHGTVLISSDRVVFRRNTVIAP